MTAIYFKKFISNGTLNALSAPSGTVELSLLCNLFGRFNRRYDILITTLSPVDFRLGRVGKKAGRGVRGWKVNFINLNGYTLLFGLYLISYNRSKGNKQLIFSL